MPNLDTRHRVRRLEQSGGGGDASTLQGHPASYFALANLTVYANSPPTASSSFRGTFIIVRTAANIDQVMVCLLNSLGVYQWRVVAQST